MRIKLQLILCNDQGDEETVTDVITLNKNNQRIEHLGLSLAESNPTLTPARYMRWLTLDKIIACGIFASRACM